MRRRRLLAAVAATGGSLPFLAGCADRITEESAVDAATRSPVPRDRSSASPTEAGTGGEECPPLGPSAVCHGTAPPDAPIVLVPTTDSVSLAGEIVGFTLHNRSDSRLLFRPYDWQVWRRLDRWVRIDGGPSGDEDRPSVGETVLSPGGSYAWQVAVGPVTVTADRPPVTVNDVEFEPGRYAFALPARADGKRTYAATFDVTE